jgi:uncharacterized protein (TIGR03437 family)
MNYLRLLRIFSVPFALTVCTSYLHALPANFTVPSTTVNLMCTMGATCTSNVAGVSTNVATVTVTNTDASASDSWVIAAPMVPWVTVSPLTATVASTATQALTFTVVPNGWQTLLPGLNSIQVVLNSATSASITFTVSLQIQPAAATLSVKGGPNVLNPYAYTLPITGVALNMPVTLVSSTGLPVSFTVATNGGTATPEGVGTGWLTTSITSGIAYSWGTTFNVTASATAMLAAQPGDILTGTVTITPATGGGSAFTMTVNILTAAPTPGALTVTPNLVPLLSSGVTAGTVNFLIHGSGFVSSPATQKTKVFYGSASATCSATVFTSCSNQVVTDNVTVISSTYLQVAIPYSSTGAPFAVAGTVAAPSLYIGVANGSSPANASIVAPIGVTALPIISAVTSASSFVEALPGTNPKATPYDIISIFGSNFCPLCTGSSSVLLGTLDAWSRFPTTLSPEGTHKITVTFSKPGTPATSLPGYLLFASNNQINVTVPGNVFSLVNGSNVVNVTVGYDTATPPVNIAAYFPLTYSAVDPGIFTMESSGQGQAAILNYNSAGTVLGVNSATNFPIGGAAANDTVSLYLTGLGTPDASGTNVASVSQGAWTAAANAFNCIAPLGTANLPGTSALAPTGYMDTVNTAYFSAVTNNAFQQPNASYAVPSPAWTSIDGAVMLASELNTNDAVPCFLESDAGLSAAAANPQITVTLVGTGGSATLTPGAGITYAGFTPNSIAGLYQINFVVPAGVGSGVGSGLASVVVTIGGSVSSVSSQALVTMWLE